MTGLPDLIEDDTSDHTDSENSVGTIQNYLRSHDRFRFGLSNQFFPPPEKKKPTFMRFSIHLMVDTIFASKTNSVASVHQLMWSISRRALFPFLQCMLLIEGDKWMTWEITKTIYFRFKRPNGPGHTTEEVDWNNGNIDLIGSCMREIGVQHEHRDKCGLSTFKDLATLLWKIYYQGTMTELLRTKSWWVICMYDKFLTPFINALRDGGEYAHTKTNHDFDTWACTLSRYPLAKGDYDREVRARHQSEFQRPLMFQWPFVLYGHVGANFFGYECEEVYL